MYFTKIDDQDYAIKPMNCPGSLLCYKRRLWSYRDFPIRMGELGQVHRHELSGALHGLMRVRTLHRMTPTSSCFLSRLKMKSSA